MSHAGNSSLQSIQLLLQGLPSNGDDDLEMFNSNLMPFMRDRPCSKDKLCAILCGSKVCAMFPFFEGWLVFVYLCIPFVFAAFFSFSVVCITNMLCVCMFLVQCPEIESCLVFLHFCSLPGCHHRSEHKMFGQHWRKMPTKHLVRGNGHPPNSVNGRRIHPTVHV